MKNWFSLQPKEEALRKMNREQYYACMSWCRMMRRMLIDHLPEDYLERQMLEVMMYGQHTMEIRHDKVRSA
jgi:hypothetical protein